MAALFEALAAQFPRSDEAREDGLLCVGGDLQPARLLAAYSQGIFPWYDEGAPILWWTPDPRCVLPLNAFQLPRRSKRALRSRPFSLSLDTAFSEVLALCAAPRAGAAGTWITPEMRAAYEQLHALGYAHSIEARRDGELLGGLYGVALGRAFFGESMFHLAPEASRAALAGLVDLLRVRNVTLLDCQQETAHIMGMGGQLLSRVDFLEQLRTALVLPEHAYDQLRAKDAFFCPWEPWPTGYVHSETSGWQPVAAHNA